MTGPVYKLWMFKYTAAWYELSEEDRKHQYSKLEEAWKKAGVKTLMGFDATWASEQWTMFGIDEFPNIEAVQKFTELLKEMDHYRYVEGVSLLGTKWET